MTATITLQTSVAEALVGQLPTPTPLRATPLTPGAASGAAGQAGGAVVASFVGALSADLALVLLDLDGMTAAGGVDAPLVSVTDVVRPALEAAAGMLGVGVLGEAVRASAASLLLDPQTTVFELSAAGVPAGWFAIRIREDAPAAAAAAVASSISGNLGRINNVEMALTVEIGRTRMAVRDVLGLEPGAVVELDRSAGAPADVLLNGRLIAHGEVVVVDQDYAVRITKILDVAEGI
ncbi:flagellar motor switch protein FliN [Curtobacterium sp. MCBD17_035]|uniref:flagellar motor switch protein FliN n=1 Tax=Curtobacterium sp. MCBD17_035 TaxID=2175673 RepID=UPI000DA9F113|nr:flagellar motor switch protein FliN [Curtobacterium sp. MCBD17_035]WIB68891.1 flagellar motor switch protein FliN [Curtobacterium sp. MCBD17_035]